MGFCSTADVFPREGGPFAEDDPTGVIYSENHVLNIYSWTKYRAEKAVSEILGLNLSQKEIFDLSYKTVLDIQGKGSGFDVAAAVYG